MNSGAVAPQFMSILHPLVMHRLPPQQSPLDDDDCLGRRSRVQNNRVQPPR